MKKYKKRMIKEYKQLHERQKKLQRILIKLEAGTLDFKPDTPEYILRDQLCAMNNYSHALRLRAEYEGINLD